MVMMIEFWLFENEIESKKFSKTKTKETESHITSVIKSNMETFKVWKENVHLTCVLMK